MVVAGVGLGAELVAGFTEAQRSAVARGFPDDMSTYSLISSIWTAAFALGAFVGPTVAGKDDNSSAVEDDRQFYLFPLSQAPSTTWWDSRGPLSLSSSGTCWSSSSLSSSWCLVRRSSDIEQSLYTRLGGNKTYRAIVAAEEEGTESLQRIM